MLCSEFLSCFESLEANIPDPRFITVKFPQSRPSLLLELAASGAPYFRGIVTLGGSLFSGTKSQHQQRWSTGLPRGWIGRCRGNRILPWLSGEEAKIRALIVHDKKMRFIVRSPQGDGLTPVIVQYTEVSVLTLRNVAVLGMNFISVYFLHCAICELTSTTNAMFTLL